MVLFDHVGAGRSDLAAYDFVKYSRLDGYAADVVEIAETLDLWDAVFVGHSVAAMIGMLAALKAPGCFAAMVMICPSPRYIDDGDYVGGFTSSDINDLLEVLDSNFLAWSKATAPTIMGNPERPELAAALATASAGRPPKSPRLLHV